MADDLPPAVTGGQDDFAALEKALDRQLALQDLEKEYIGRILEQTGGNKVRAAQILGIDRKTLYRKLAEPNKPKSLPLTAKPPRSETSKTP